MASVVINDAPKRISMLDFRTVSNKYGTLAKSCRFIARILPAGELLKRSIARGSLNVNELSYLCEATEFPGRGFMNVDVRYYGPNQKLPFQSVYEDINMTFLCRADSLEREFFDNWMNVINPINTFDFNYKDDYKTQIDLFLYSDVQDSLDDSSFGGEVNMEGPIPTYKFSLIDAYPVLVNPQPVTWADDQFLRLGITFTYRYWTRARGLDPVSGTGDGSRNYNLVEGFNNIGLNYR